MLEAAPQYTPPVLVSTLLSVISSAQTQPPLFPTTSFVDLGAQTVMATGDFNGDGQPDLVTIPALNRPLIVSTLLNAANPTPPLIVTTNLGSNISIDRLRAVDMNNDKKLDLVANAFNGPVPASQSCLATETAPFSHRSSFPSLAQAMVLLPTSTVTAIPTLPSSRDYPDLAQCHRSVKSRQQCSRDLVRTDILSTLHLFRAGWPSQYWRSRLQR